MMVDSTSRSGGGGSSRRGGGASVTTVVPGGGSASLGGGSVRVTISGIRRSMKKQDLIAFLQQNCPEPFRAGTLSIAGAIGTLEVDSQRSGIALERLSGIAFQGAVLQLKMHHRGSKGRGGGSSSSSGGGGKAETSASGSGSRSGGDGGMQRYEAAMMAYLQSRFDAQTGTLDLSNVAAMQPADVRIDVRNRTTVNKLCHLIQSSGMGPSVRGLSLSGNQLTSLRDWGNIVPVVPALETLSLESNDLKMFRDLDPLRVRQK